MSISNFVPQLWSARLMDSLKKALVFGDCVNTDYEGEISGQGSVVKVNTIGAITIDDYDKTEGTGDPEEITSRQNTLTIDQAKFFNFKVEDVDAAQANLNVVDGAMQEAAYGLANVMDAYIAGLHTQADEGNVVGADTAVEIDVADAYDSLVDLATILNENNVPNVNRFVVVPPWYLGLLAKDPRFTTNPTVLANGVVDGQNIAGLEVRMSNNVAEADGVYNVVAGYKGAITFAQQVDSVEAYRPEKSFADAVKGLQLYGAKVFRPKAIAVLNCSKK